MTTIETYMDLVRRALWQQETVWNTDATDALLRLNAMQGTGALVFPSVLGQADIPAQAKMQMKGMCMQTMQQHVHLQHILEQAWTALEQAGIRAVLMKGAGLAALYPEPQMRQWGDIDLYVGADQYHPACAVMRNTFPDALKFDEELDHYKHYNLIADGVSIEVHRVTMNLPHPLDDRRYRRMERFGMTHSESLDLNGLKVRVPEPTFNMLFVFLHAWEHMQTSGANVRQLCDIALMLHRYKDTIDRPRLHKWLRQLHLMEVWKLYMGLMQMLALPEEETLFYKGEKAHEAERLLKDLLAGRMNSKLYAQPVAPSKNRFVRKWRTMQQRLNEAKRMAQYCPAYGRHMAVSVLLSGAGRLFAKDRHWE